MQTHASPEAGQILEDTLVVAVNACGQAAALRTPGTGRRAGQLEPDGRGLDAGRVEPEGFRIEQERLKIHDRRCVSPETPSPNVRKFPKSF